MNDDSLVNSIVPDKNLSCQEIYYGSKKYDDFERISSLHYHVHLLSAIGLDSNRKDKVIPIRKNRTEICQKIWRGSKVSFLLNPSSKDFTIYLKAVIILLKLRIKEVNDEFIRCQDLEVLDYPNPDPFQINRLHEIDQILRLAEGEF